MLMKIHNKGQVVIPSRIRHLLGVRAGDYVELDVDMPRRRLRLWKPRRPKLLNLAGVLARYKGRREFPSRAQRRALLTEGLSRAR